MTRKACGPRRMDNSSVACDHFDREPKTLTSTVAPRLNCICSTHTDCECFRRPRSEFANGTQVENACTTPGSWSWLRGRILPRAFRWIVRSRRQWFSDRVRPDLPASVPHSAPGIARLLQLRCKCAAAGHWPGEACSHHLCRNISGRGLAACLNGFWLGQVASAANGSSSNEVVESSSGSQAAPP